MCGLAGLAGPGINQDDLEAFYDLMWVTGLRGPHSTGLYTYTPTGQFSKPKHRLAKRLGTSSYFLRCDDSAKVEEKMIRSIFTEVFLGHCRWATQGEINHENAHPFNTGKLISAHNGTLKDKAYQDKDKTDSLMMFEDMEKRGIKEVLSDLDWLSAYAVSIFDKTKKKIYLARNSLRPLHIAVRKDSRVVYWASELEAIRFCLERQKADIPVDYYVIDPDCVLSFSLSDIRAGQTFWDYEKVESKSQTIYSGYGNFGADDPHANDPVAPEDIYDSCDADFCCSCGQILRGDSLRRADSYRSGSVMYYTCQECICGTNIKTGKEK